MRKEYKPGWIKSNRRNFPKNIIDKMEIYRGIHVFVRKPKLHVVHDAHCVVLRIKCYLSDFIGTNANKSEEVYMKVEVTQADYDMAIGGKTTCV